MTLDQIQNAIVAAISVDLTNFEAGSVFADLGQAKNAAETRLAGFSTVNNIQQGGYNVFVWPPAMAHLADEAAGLDLVNATCVVRFEVNPLVIVSLANLNPAPNGPAWVAGKVKAIVADVLGANIELNQTKFQLAPDSIELVSFDQGLIAYHIRFWRTVAIGIGS